MYLKADPAGEKWWLVFKVMGWNLLLVAITASIMHYFGELTLNDYKNACPQFFSPFGEFRKFFRETVWITGIVEEVLYRGPVWVLSSTGLVFYIRNFRLHPWLFWLAILIPNYFWAIGHSPAALPIFVAGLGYGWLVARTRSLWPAIVAHCASNLLIYLVIKIAALFIKI
ncbi:MAG: CPBP family intramembrane metalloprotease [Candidatus Taylorbacteria bacterium]|nr:CPBP family intramembrane metalloprotease [Candidatus Taylorbacteria bacterium]